MLPGYPHRLMTVARIGADILASPEMQRERTFMQHGDTSCLTHSLSVACTSLLLADGLRLKIDRDSMVRGALLHDFYLYDWHIAESHPRGHGFSHPRTALRNAERLFSLNDIERDVIRKHMFPLTLTPPRYRESVLVSLADKLCALRETFAPLKRKGG